MKCTSLLLLVFAGMTGVTFGQTKSGAIDLQSLATHHQLKAITSEAEARTEEKRYYVHFKETENDDVAWLDGRTFGNGVIELDIRGRDVPQKSFIGVAFHGVDNQTKDIVYFRPFNFRSTDSVRKIHAVQYVSEPDYSWKRLREERNGKYEKAVVPAPGGNDWFHARIEVHGAEVKVFVNGNTQPSLTVDKLNQRTTGKIGLWIGPASGGDFANLSIKDE